MFKLLFAIYLVM